jgi:hypothetical protein
MNSRLWSVDVNPYQSPHNPSDHKETVAVSAPRWFYRVVFPVLAIIPGGCAGFQCMLPAPPELGEGTCGLPAILATVIGAPVGAAVFAVTAGFIGRIVDRIRT